MVDYLVSPRPKHLERLGFGVDYFPRYVHTRLTMHRVDMVLFSVFLSGHATHYLEGSRFDESGGSVGVTHYNELHDVRTGAEGIEIANVVMDLERHPLPPLPRDLETVLPSFLPLHPNFGNRLNRIVRFEFEDRDRLREMVLRMHDELESERPGFETVATNLFQNFLVQCCREVLRQGVQPSESPVSDVDRRLETVRHHLDRHHRDTITLEALADLAGMTPTYLSRRFRRYTGKTVFGYLIDRRIQGAMILLRNGRDKIHTVAMESGFNDLSYFNRSFRERVGCTPSSYRKRFA